MLYYYEREILICNGTVNYDELDNVSGLYSIGTVTGWYLTMIGLWITWCFHPAKRPRDVISVDQIVVVTLPMVALGHLIYLMRNQTSWRLEGWSGTDDTDPLYEPRWDTSQRKEQFASYAPWTILRIYQIWSGLLVFNLWVFTGRCKRATLTFVPAFIGTNIRMAYDHMFSLQKSWSVSNPQGTEPVDFRWPMMIILNLFMTVYLFIGFICLMLIRRPSDQSDAKVAPSWFGPSLGLTMFMVDFFYAANVYGSPPTRVSVQECLSEHHSNLRFVFFPYSKSSYTDLDQAVAVAAGATILLTRLYSVCLHRYKDWRYRQQRRALLNNDTTVEGQPAYADEEEGPNETSWAQTGSDDIVLSTLTGPPSLEAADLPGSNDGSPAPQSDFVMSGALVMESEDSEETDAPLPLAARVDSSTRELTASRHVHFADELSNSTPNESTD